METIVVALIAGVLSLLGVIITSNKTTRDVQDKLDKRQAWFLYRMAYLHSEQKSICYAFLSPETQIQRRQRWTACC